MTTRPAARPKADPDAGAYQTLLSALDKLEALKPKAVVAGHKVPENDDDPRIIAETRQYLRDFDRLNEATANARELYDVMLELYPRPRQSGLALGRSQHRQETGIGSSH